MVIRILEVDFLLVAGLRTHEAFIESRTCGFAEEGAEFLVFREFLLFTINNNFDIVANDNVALLGFAVNVFVLAPHLHEAVEFGLDFFFMDGGSRNGDARVSVALDIDFRINFDFDLQCDVVLFVVVEFLHNHLANRNDVSLLKRILNNRVHDFINRFVTDGGSKLLQDHGLRNLTLAEALQGNLLLVLGKLLFERCLEITLRDRNFKGAHGGACFFDFSGHIYSDKRLLKR